MPCKTDQPAKVSPHIPDLSVQRPRTLLVPYSGLQGAPCGPYLQQPLSSSQKPEPLPSRCTGWNVCFGLWVVGTRPVCSSLLHADPCLLCNHRPQRAQTFNVRFFPHFPMVTKGQISRREAPASTKAYYTVTFSELTHEDPPPQFLGLSYDYLCN